MHAVEEESPVAWAEGVFRELAFLCLAYSPMLQEPAAEDAWETAGGEWWRDPVLGVVEGDIGHGGLGDMALGVVKNDVCIVRGGGKAYACAGVVIDCALGGLCGGEQTSRGCWLGVQEEGHGGAIKGCAAE
jgi:hypothetical protein